MKGSTFVISLPICSSHFVEKTTEPPQPQVDNDSTTKSQELQTNTIKFLRKHIDPKTKVLIVEDNALNQTLLVKMLDQLELQCDLASNGLEALHRLFPNYKDDDDGNHGTSFSNHQEKYSLLLVDLEMPIMSCVSICSLLTKHVANYSFVDGPTCIGKLRRDGCTLPVVLMSAHPLSEQQRLLQQNKATVQYFLPKPFNTADLCRALTSILIDSKCIREQA